ncbi:MAG: TAT-variant-translocated molybdopterin oxidoreductase, partial [Chloroflexota bacterium]
MTLHNDTGTPDAAMPEDQPKKWLNTEELAQLDEFEAYLEEHHPRQAKIMRQYGMDRRTFLKVMGASLTMAGFGLQGCTTADAPGEGIIPYVRMPEHVIPGEPLFFTSTMTLGGYGTGVLIETHEGRPHRIEGNTNHPASLGGADPILMSSILELYNPDRSTVIRNENGVQTWEAYLTALAAVLENAGDGAGIRILTETVTSPTLISQIEAIQERFPAAQWHHYEPVSRDNVMAGAELAFGEKVDTIYSYGEADVILSLDSDFLTNQPGSLVYAREFVSGRQVRSDSSEAANVSMNRLYAVESTPTNTGATADHRMKMRPSEIEGFTHAVANALGMAVDAPEATWDETWFAALIEDLESARGTSLVVAGPEQPAVVHAMVHAINAELGNVGTTLNYIEPVAAYDTLQSESLSTLVADMNAGAVTALFILGGNPVYNAPVDIDFTSALDGVPFSTHLSLYFDETSANSRWHVPATHYVEEWSDARAYDGTASIVQPPIGPLLDTTHSAHEILAAIAGDDRRSYDILREYWEGEFSGDDFDAYWNRSLHDGVLEGTAAAPVSVSLDASVLSAAPTAALSGEGLELIIQPDPNIYDGRFANNAWLQELPKPMTKITWDNTALLSPATALRLGVSNQDVVEITAGDRTMQAPVWIMPLHPDGAVTVSLG